MMHGRLLLRNLREFSCCYEGLYDIISFTMKNVVILASIFTVVTMFNACGNNNTELNSELEKAMSIQDLTQKLNSLIAIDQKYNSVEAKINIGSIYLQNGMIDKAGDYLLPAQNTIGGFSADIQYVYYVNLSEYYFRKNDYPNVNKSALRAIEISKDDRLGARFTYSKSLYAQTNQAEALKNLDGLWKSDPQKFNPEDLTIYLDLLIGAKNWPSALLVAHHYEKRFGYRQNLGVLESAIHQALNQLPLSALMLIKEIDYKRSVGLIEPDEIRSVLDQTKKEYSMKQINDSSVIGLLDGYGLLITGKSLQAASLMLPIVSILQDPYAIYLMLNLKISAGNPSMESLSELVDLESNFTNYPPYYELLLNGMKNGKGRYTLDTAQAVLEKLIALAPRGKGKDAKIELGTLMDFDASQTEILLTREEIDNLAIQILGDRNIEQIDLIIQMFNLPPNSYSDYAFVAVRTLLNRQEIALYIQNNFNKYSKNVQRRLKEMIT